VGTPAILSPCPLCRAGFQGSDCELDCKSWQTMTRETIDAVMEFLMVLGVGLLWVFESRRETRHLSATELREELDRVTTWRDLLAWVCVIAFVVWYDSWPVVFALLTAVALRWIWRAAGKPSWTPTPRTQYWLATVGFVLFFALLLVVGLFR
jgi:hypothetical protein